MRFTSREILGVFLVIALLLLSLGAWQSFFTLSLNPDGENTLLAVLWFSLLGTVYFLGSVIWERKLWGALGLAFIFLPSFFFTQSFMHVPFVILSFLLGLLSLRSVQKEMRERVRFYFIRSVRAGSFSFILALALSLSSAYFVSIRDLSWEDLIPRFRIGENTASIVFKTAGYFYPEYRKLSQTGMTVDQFLGTLQKNTENVYGVDTLSPEERERMEQMASTLPELVHYLRTQSEAYGMSAQDTLAEELYLRGGRLQISHLAGRPITGDERVVDVFSYVLQRKMLATLSAEEASERFSPQAVPSVLALLLFLTLLPVASLLALFWVFFGAILFWVAQKMGWVKVTQKPVEQEGLEH